MAKTDISGMSYAELSELETKLASLKAEKQNAERAALKQRLTTIAKEAGFDIHDLFGRGRGGKGGKVAPKYRDPKNPANTWTGPWAHAPLACRRDQRQQGQARRFDQIDDLAASLRNCPGGARVDLVS